MPICITFAGPVGSSKTPIATYLSWNLNLPVFNNDAIRSEVAEDLGKFDVEVYKQRQKERAEQLIQSGINCILDASIDREWPNVKPKLLEKGYKCFIISLDLSRELMEKLHKSML
jgi:predicted kinase